MRRPREIHETHLERKDIRCSTKRHLSAEAQSRDAAGEVSGEVCEESDHLG